MGAGSVVGVRLGHGPVHGGDHPEPSDSLAASSAGGLIGERVSCSGKVSFVVAKQVSAEKAATAASFGTAAEEIPESSERPPSASLIIRRVPEPSSSSVDSHTTAVKRLVAA